MGPVVKKPKKEDGYVNVKRRHAKIKVICWMKKTQRKVLICTTVVKNRIPLKIYRVTKMETMVIYPPIQIPTTKKDTPSTKHKSMPFMKDKKRRKERNKKKY